MEVNLLELLAAVGLPLAYYLIRRLRGDAEVLVSDPIFFGTIRSVNVGVASTFEGRRYVTLEYQEGEDPVDVQLLFSTQQAARLAQLLRIAATDGRTVAVARAVARKR